MHMVIRAIVYAKNQGEAVNVGEDVFNRLVEGTSFDYYQLFNGNDDWGNAIERWGSQSIASKYKSKEGKELVVEGWESTYRDLKGCFNKAKEILAKHDTIDSLLRANSMDRWYIGQLGRTQGSNCWLFDNDGCGIMDEGHLDDTLEKWKCLYEDKDKPNPYKDYDVWGEPADVDF